MAGDESRERTKGVPEPLDLSARGGAGTLRGVDYQLRVAILDTLSLIHRQLSAPHLRLVVTVEPLIEGAGKTEKWDFAIEGPIRAFEAKVKPTAADVREFLKKAATSSASSIELVFGEATAAMKQFFALTRLRAAVGGDREKFNRLLDGAEEQMKNAAKQLGEDPFAALNSIRHRNIPEDFVDSAIETKASELASDRGGDLVSMLVDTFAAEANKRVPHRVTDLMQIAAKRGIELGVQSDSSVDLSAEARAMLLVLDRMEIAIPTAVLASAAGVSDPDVADVLAELKADGVVAHHEGRWTISELQVRMHSVREPDVLAAALDGLLDWISDHRLDPQVIDDVDVAVALSRLVGDRDRDRATQARVFRVLDKHLKRRGDLRLVYEVADRSIRAAKDIRSEAVASAEAIALICGRSWVYQRVGELTRARADGEKSLEIGEALGDLETVAFCHKCLGRMYRMDAEQADGQQRRDLLAASVDHLQEAIDRFTELGNTPEVGDAFSLLARTHLVAQDYESCALAIEEAVCRLVDPHHKDYRDLQIVRADLVAAGGDDDGAKLMYTEVVDALQADAHLNEIRARALYQRGMLTSAPADERVADLVAAAEIFDALGQHLRAAGSELAAMELQGRLPTRANEPQVAPLLEGQPAVIQVLAVRKHEELVNAAAFEAVAFRDRAAVVHWEEMVRQAQREDARRGRFW